MPSDKWQLIIYPDSAETTHLSNRHAHTHMHPHVRAPQTQRRAAELHLRVSGHEQLSHLDEASLSGLARCPARLRHQDGPKRRRGQIQHTPP